MPSLVVSLECLTSEASRLCLVTQQRSDWEDVRDVRMQPAKALLPANLPPCKRGRLWHFLTAWWRPGFSQKLVKLVKLGQLKLSYIRGSGSAWGCSQLRSPGRLRGQTAPEGSARRLQLSAVPERCAVAGSGVQGRDQRVPSTHFLQLYTPPTKHSGVSHTMHKA